MSILLLLASVRLMRLKKISKPEIFLLAISFIWFIWGTISLFWTPDINSGIKELVGIGLGLLLVFSLVFLVANHIKVLNAVRLGWVAAFIFTLPIAVWEFITNQHLPSSVGSNLARGSNPFIINFATVTFGNRNTYITFIAVVFPFLIWGLNIAKTWRGKLFYYGLIFAAVSLTFLNASRLGILIIGVYSLFWISSIIFPKGLKSLFAMRARSIVSSIFIIAVISVLFIQVWQNTTLTRLRIISAFSGQDESLLIRTDLIENGISMLKNTLGMGVGAGGFERSITLYPELYIRGATNPHNLIVEIFSQYGIIIGCLFFLWLGYCFLLILAVPKIIEKLKPNQEKDFYKNAVFTGFLLLIGFPFYTSINSSFITFTFFWATIASIALITSMSYQIIKIRRNLITPP